MESLGFSVQNQAELESLTREAVKTSEIEGEILAVNKVRSSIARRLGLDIAGLVPSGRRVDGVVEMTLDASRSIGEPLTRERLFRWHEALFPGAKDLTIGSWRDDAKGPMQVVSGALGESTVHYEAPPAERLTGKDGLDITDWLTWFTSCLNNAFTSAESAVSAALNKERFWKENGGAALNERQSLILNRLLDGFEGKLTTQKWSKLAKCSHDTALRDIADLVERGILVKDEAGGRSTSYSLKPQRS